MELIFHFIAVFFGLRFLMNGRTTGTYNIASHTLSIEHGRYSGISSLDRQCERLAFEIRRRIQSHFSCLCVNQPVSPYYYIHTTY